VGGLSRGSWWCSNPDPLKGWTKKNPEYLSDFKEYNT